MKLHREFKETTNQINAQTNAVVNDAVQARLNEINANENSNKCDQTSQVKRPKLNNFEGIMKIIIAFLSIEALSVTSQQCPETKGQTRHGCFP